MTCRAFTTDLAAFFSCWVVLAVLFHFPIKVLEQDLLNMPSSSLSPFKYLHLGLVTVDVALLSHFRHFFSIWFALLILDFNSSNLKRYMSTHRELQVAKGLYICFQSIILLRLI